MGARLLRGACPRAALGADPGARNDLSTMAFPFDRGRLSVCPVLAKEPGGQPFAAPRDPAPIDIFRVAPLRFGEDLDRGGL
jgi:hypothetical protein